MQSTNPVLSLKLMIKRTGEGCGIDAKEDLKLLLPRLQAVMRFAESERNDLLTVSYLELLEYYEQSVSIRKHNELIKRPTRTKVSYVISKAESIYRPKDVLDHRYNFCNLLKYILDEHQVVKDYPFEVIMYLDEILNACSSIYKSEMTALDSVRIAKATHILRSIKVLREHNVL